MDSEEKKYVLQLRPKSDLERIAKRLSFRQNRNVLTVKEERGTLVTREYSSRSFDFSPRFDTLH